MNKLWESIIFPIVKELKPTNIIEIGADKGENTLNILEYCIENNSYLTSIDPFPSFDINDFKNIYGEKFNIIKDLSLNVLSSMDDYDLIFLDGDHNWYTIYNELKCIEKNFNQDSFPFIFFHDISWPYARRDLYYNPDDIPNDYLNDYAKKGIFPDKNKLLDYGGFNSSLCNALYENTPKNGVLTGIEDFLKETNLNLSFKVINAFRGLGFMYSSNYEIDEMIDRTILNCNITGIMEKYYTKQIILLQDDLKSKQKEIERLNIKFDKLLSSNSWKITKPFRWLKNKL